MPPKEDGTTGEDNVHDAGEQQHDAGDTGEKTEANPNAQHFDAMRGIVKDMKAELSDVRNENAQLRNAILNPQQKEKDPFEGRDETDYPTIAEMRANDARLRKELQKDKEAFKKETTLSSFLSSTPDYDKIMNEYGKHLPLKVREFYRKYKNDPDAMGAAYEACKDGSAFQKANMTTQEHENTRRASENMRRPGAGSSSGSGGTLSLANKLKNMTSQERLDYSDECVRKGGR